MLDHIATQFNGYSIANFAFTCSTFFKDAFGNRGDFPKQFHIVFAAVILYVTRYFAMASSSKQSDKPKLPDLSPECREAECELIEIRRVRVVCWGPMETPHKPAFLFSELHDREFINHHLVSGFSQFLSFLCAQFLISYFSIGAIFFSFFQPYADHLIACIYCGVAMPNDIKFIEAHILRKCGAKVLDVPNKWVCRTHGTVSCFLF